MKIAPLPFTAIDWSRVEATRHEGESGHALWRSFTIGNIRVRLVEYSPGYVADHWCDRGHIIHVVSGALISELKDGRRTELTAGMSYMVSDFGDAAHRSVTETGATLFIVD